MLKDVGRQITQKCHGVDCQRPFLQQEHSQYFEVRRNDKREGDHNSDRDAWSQAWEEASQHYNKIRAEDVIQPGEADEVNPWLRRTGWIPYLEDCSSKDILRCI